MKKKTKKQWLWEFTKRLVVAVTIIFVIAIIFAEVVIWKNPDSSAIGTFVECMCDVFKVTVVAYAAKACIENREKIRSNPLNDDPGGHGYERDDI